MTGSPDDPRPRCLGLRPRPPRQFRRRFAGECRPPASTGGAAAISRSPPAPPAGPALLGRALTASPSASSARFDANASITSSCSTNDISDARCAATSRTTTPPARISPSTTTAPIRAKCERQRTGASLRSRRSADFITAIGALPECPEIQRVSAATITRWRPSFCPSPPVGLLDATVPRGRPGASTRPKP
jgi:hypothetical protein